MIVKETVAAVIGMPLTLEVNLTLLVTVFAMDLKPAVKTVMDAQSADYELSLADWLVLLQHVVINDLKKDLVSDVFDVEIKGLVPVWLLAGVFLDRCLVAIFSVSNLDEGVLFTTSVNIVFQVCGYYS